MVVGGGGGWFKLVKGVQWVGARSVVQVGKGLLRGLQIGGGVQVGGGGSVGYGGSVVRWFRWRCQVGGGGG